MDILVNQKANILLIGATGTGKTITITNKLLKYFSK